MTSSSTRCKPHVERFKRHVSSIFISFIFMLCRACVKIALDPTLKFLKSACVETQGHVRFHNRIMIDRYAISPTTFVCIILELVDYLSNDVSPSFAFLIYRSLGEHSSIFSTVSVCNLSPRASIRYHSNSTFPRLH